MKEHNEKFEAYALLDKEEERPDAHLRTAAGRGGCRPGLKAVNGTCVHKDTPVSLALHNNLSLALNKLRDKLLTREVK